MNQIIKRLSIGIFTILSFQNCDYKEVIPGPVITEIYPGSGVPGASVTMKGKNFTKVTNDLNVQFNGVIGLVTLATDTILNVVVPSEATTGKIKLTVRDQTVVSEFDFIVYTPEYEPNVTVSTYIEGMQGYVDGPLTSAKFDSPIRLTVDANDNIYVTESSHSKIRKISVDGIVSTFAGSTPGYSDGEGTNAQFNRPQGLAADANGNIYVADEGNHKIRMITPNGYVTTLAGGESGYADGQVSSALFSRPDGIGVDALGNLYIADANKIRKLTPDGYVSTPFNLIFNSLHLAVGTNSNIYAGGGDSPFVKITPDNTMTYLRIGEGYMDGPAGSARMYVLDLTTDKNGNLYVADCINYAIRKIRPDGYVTTVAGAGYGYKDGNGNEAKFDYYFGVAADSQGNIYVAETAKHRIRKIVIN